MTAYTKNPTSQTAAIAEPQAPSGVKSDEVLRAEIESIIRADHGDPFGILGMHTDGPDGAVTVRTFMPEARRVELIDGQSGETIGDLEKIHSDGFWSLTLRDRQTPFRYRFRIEFATHTGEFEDAYRFPPVLGQLDVHLLAEGTHLRSFERLGAHPHEMDGVSGTAFAVWAPNATRVSVIGEFCNWDGRRLPMRKRHECGVWELFVPHVAKGDRYKYEIRGPSGNLMPPKADPYAFRSELPPHTASIVNGLDRHEWRDQEWLRDRARTDWRAKPVSIYECHISSWRRPDGEGGLRYLTYDELGDQLVPYVKEMGYTHIELLPITEFPFDGSWGYQPIGMYAPTSRHGDPAAFARFVERCHTEGIGLLLDWVPGHFPTDPHGLGMFDGTHLYEHADPRQGFHQDWNTLIYNFGRREVSSFLLGSALYWMDQFHFDGIRVDAVASMLYLDYSRQADQWVPNQYGGNENLEAVAFLKRMNELVYANHPGGMTVAEESTSWPGVSRPVYLGGLGFGFKWNMGWMHDTLSFMSKDPIHRRYHHHSMTFGMVYAYSENFVLPLSHDEVVHGKGSLLNKMPGDRWQKFANLRAYYGFMWTHPGKKLLFMGGEFGQEREWNHNQGLDWFLLDDPFHKGVQTLIRDLNHLYRDTAALHELDNEPAGFEWIEANDSDNSVLAFLRYGKDRERPIVSVSNFTPLPRQGYRVGVPAPGFYRERLNTDAGIYGGGDVGNNGGVEAEEIPHHGRPYSICLTVPPLGTLILERA
jgi:1,4-alpha-glucan branching enzyme